MDARCAEGAELGLVDRVEAPEMLLDAAVMQARAMGSNPQQALRTVKELLTVNANEPDLARVQQRVPAALEVCYRSPEHRGRRCLLEKREPDFRAARAQD